MYAPTVVRPHPGRATLGERLADWLEEGIATAGRTTDGPAALVLVPEYVRACPRSVLTDLDRIDWTGILVALVGYGGRTRGRFAIEDAREVLDGAGARVLETSLGLDTARIRAVGLEPADLVLRELLLDDLMASGPVSRRCGCHRT